MPTNRARSRPRRHSLSSGDESFYPRPVKIDGLGSTSDLSDAFDPSPDTVDYGLGNDAPERADVVNLPELAAFLRTAVPPPDRPVSHDEYFGWASSSEHKRWSLPSLRRNKRMRLQRRSLQIQLPENKTPGITAEDHRYVAISAPVPGYGNFNSSWFRSQYPVLSPSLPPTAASRERPGRNPLKVALLSDKENGASVQDLKSSPLSAPPHVDGGHSSTILNGKAARVGQSLDKACADYLIKTALNQDSPSGGLGHHSGASTNMLGQRAAILERPPTASKRADTLISDSAGWPDDVVTQKQLGSRYAHTDRPMQVLPSPSQYATAKPHLRSGSLVESTVRRLGERRSFLQGEDLPLSERDLKSKSCYRSSGPSCEELILSFRNSSDGYKRESLASLLTTSLDCQQSTFTYSPSRSSSASEISIQSTAITSQMISDDIKQISGVIGLPTAELHISTEKMDIDTSAPRRRDVGLAEVCDPNLDRKHDNPRRPNLRLSMDSNSNIEANAHPKTIHDWRQARRAKVREYKMRDLDASRAELMGSSVQGKSPFQTSGAHNSTPQTFPAPTKGGQRPSASNKISTIMGQTPDNFHQVAKVNTSADWHDQVFLKKVRNQAQAEEEVHRTPGILLSISSVISTEIEPIYLPAPHGHTNTITMSPIMVVADVESRSDSPALRLAIRARPETLMLPRTMLRPNSLKIAPVTRQKPQTVTMSRNPSTGAIERSAMPPIDPKLKRRSLMNLPTPPLSPDTTRLSKRLSLPPAAFKGRTSPLRRWGWNSSYGDEPEPEPVPVPGSESESESETESESEPRNRARSMTLQERVMREKLQKEKEITDIVARTVGLPQKQIGSDDESNPVPLEQSNADTLEKRLRRLERNKDAWLSAMKPLLETMARTLDDMRADDKSASLRVSDFMVDVDAEAGRITKNLCEEEDVSQAWQDYGDIEMERKKTECVLESSDLRPLSPVPQELDDLSILDDQTRPETAISQDSSGIESSPLRYHGITGSSHTLPIMDTETYEAMKHQMLRKESIMGAVAQKETAAASDGIHEAAESSSWSEPEESNDWSDVDPIIRDFSKMSRKSKEFNGRIYQAADGNGGEMNPLSPIMQELMSASKLWKEEVGDGH
ncbi:hypothetical protein GGS21DRAFT_495504 [Xylaria nigripes]|nr:hypothetical protein GGS21DRAFT_495504 [Xylaria nigripes]